MRAISVLAVAAAGCLGHANPRGTHDTLSLACSAAAEDCAPQTRSYTVHARAGQTLTVALSPHDGRVILSDIVDPHGTSAIPDDADERFWFGWTVDVKETGAYVVTVSTTETATASNPYSLTMTLR